MEKLLIIILFFLSTFVSGQEWDHLGELSGWPINQIVISSDTNETIFVVRSRLYHSIDGGIEWRLVSNEKCYKVAIDPINSEIIYILVDSKILKSVDAGKNWFNPCEELVLNNDFSGTITIDPIQTDTIYVGLYNWYWPTYGGLYRSYNGGENWDSLWVPSSVIRIDPINRNVIYANKYFATGLWKSSDYGTSWDEINFGIIDSTYAKVTDIYISKDFPNIILISVNKYGFFISENRGNTWTQSNAGLLDSIIRVKKIIGNGARIYAIIDKIDESGTTISSGVYTSLLDSIFLKPVGNPNTFLGLDPQSIAYSKKDNKLFVGTDNNGIYTYSFNPVSVEKNQENDLTEFSLKQNYPNPFNPSTLISYSIPQNGFVTLTVYDITGKKITKIVNQIQKAGNYKVNFDVSNLNKHISSGVYLYKLQIGNLVQTKKMIHLR